MDSKPLMPEFPAYFFAYFPDWRIRSDRPLGNVLSDGISVRYAVFVLFNKFKKGSVYPKKESIKSISCAFFIYL